MSVIDEILDFWFAGGRAETWFAKDTAFDREVRAHLSTRYEQAAAGALDDWRDGPEGCVALCVLLDQVPRNLFRGDPRAYATDAAARDVTHHALAQGFDRDLPQNRRLFLYLPLEHSEALGEQQLAVRLIGRLDEDPDWREHAIQHRGVIARFGRFPHRNAVLGRETTPEEAEFLTRAGSSS